jgi:hypothetical protein
MPKRSIVALCLPPLLLLCACSPRNFLTRRLAADLIASSDAFRAPQLLWLRTGVISNKDYLSPDYVVLEHRGWISGTKSACPAGLAPAPCWDVMLTPSGVDTFQPLISEGDRSKQYFSVPAARRELSAITGIIKQGKLADVEFNWKWVPLNEIGAALYSGELQYKSTTSFRDYDDGWRLVDSTVRSGQTVDDALKNAEPAAAQ